MREFGKVYSVIWDSDKFNNLTLENGEPDEQARILYCYIHTCKHCNSSGCYRLREGYASTDLRWPIERYREAIDRLCRSGLIEYDIPSQTVLITNFLPFNLPTNAKHALNVFDQLGAVSCERLKIKRWQELSEYCVKRKYTLDPQVGKAIDSLCCLYTHTETKTKTEKEIETETKTEIKTETLGGGSAREAIGSAASPIGAAEPLPVSAKVGIDFGLSVSKLKTAGPSQALIALANSPPIRDAPGIVSSKRYR